jgi:hypothetical protein
MPIAQQTRGPPQICSHPRGTIVLRVVDELGDCLRPSEHFCLPSAAPPEGSE